MHATNTMKPQEVFDHLPVVHLPDQTQEISSVI